MDATKMRNPENAHKRNIRGKIRVLHAPNGEKRTETMVTGRAIEKRIIRFRINVGNAKLMLILFNRRQVAMAWGKGKPIQYRKGMSANAAPTPAMVRIAVKLNTRSAEKISAITLDLFLCFQ